MFSPKAAQTLVLALRKNMDLHFPVLIDILLMANQFLIASTSIVSCLSEILKFSESVVSSAKNAILILKHRFGKSKTYTKNKRVPNFEQCGHQFPIFSHWKY